MKPAPLPSIETLRELLELHPGGGLTWKARSVKYFRSNGTFLAWNRRNAGNNATWPSKDGYLRVSILGRNFTAHRLVYAIANGISPGDLQIDHRDGNRQNNSPENLRLCTQTQNHCNKAISKSSSTGVKGLNRTADGWRAQIRFQGIKHTKRSTNKEVAIAWLDAKRAELHGEFANSGFR